MQPSWLALAACNTCAGHVSWLLFFCKLLGIIACKDLLSLVQVP